MKTKVLILLACYNGIEWIEEQIRSILVQVDCEITILCSVDKSTDGTEELVDYLSSLDQRILTLKHGQCFGSAGLNFFRLLREADFSDYEYIAFSDQDDIWHENKIANATKKIKENKCHAYSSNVTAFWSNGRSLKINKAQKQKKWDHYFEAAGPGCTYVLSASSATQLKKLITKNQEIVTGIALHDWLIYAWARHNGLNWFIDPEPGMRYRQHSSNVIGVNTGLMAAKSRMEKLNNGWYLKQIVLISDAINADNVKPIQWIKNPSFLNKIKLLFSISEFRRRFRDRLGFAVFIMMLREHEK